MAKKRTKREAGAGFHVEEELEEERALQRISALKTYEIY